MADLQELPWDRVSVAHIGRRLHVQYERPERYDVGRLVGIGADNSAITLYLEHGAQPVALRRQGRGVPAPPRLWLLPE